MHARAIALTGAFRSATARRACATFCAMSTARRSTTLALVVLLVACGAAACVHTRARALAPSVVTTIAYGYQTGLRTPAQLVIRTEEDWASVWKRHHSRTLPAPPLPPVDFTREMVLGVAPGERPTGGYGVRIASVRVDDGRMRVEVRETRPADGAVVPMVLSSPYELVKVPRFDGEVVFVTS